MRMNKVSGIEVIKNTENGFNTIESKLRTGEYNLKELAINLNCFLYQNSRQINISDMTAEERREIMNYRSLRLWQIFDYIDGYICDE